MNKLITVIAGLLVALAASTSAQAAVATRGDVNQDTQVNSADIQMIADIIAGTLQPTETQRALADVNGDGLVDAADIAAVVAIITNGPATEPAWVGGDMSMLSAYEAHHQLARTKYKIKNVGYYDVDGVAINDVLTYVAEQGWNTVRVRLFVNPANADASDKGEGVIQNLDTVVNLGKRIKAAGLRFVLDFHYSDSWADPVQQYTPADWADLDDDALADTIYTYTRHCLRVLRDAGAVPDAIQTGNEISYGMLWGPVGTSTSSLLKCNSGSDANWDRFTRLLKQAGKACREICPYAKIILHTERLARTSIMLNFYDKMKSAEVDYDVIGLSYYPYYHGKISVLSSGLSTLELRYPDKEIMIVETGHSYHYKVGDTDTDYALTYEGQKEFTTALVTTLKRYDCVTGVIWWFPEANEYGLGGSYWNALHVNDGWYNAGLWDHETGRALPALQELSTLNDE